MVSSSGVARLVRRIALVSGMGSILIYATMVTAFAQQPGCPGEPIPPPPSSGDVVVTVRPPTTEQVLPLKAGQTVGDIDLVWTITEGSAPTGDLGFGLGPFRQGTARLAAGALLLSLVGVRGDSIELNLCLDKSPGGGIPPGTYVGSIRILDPRISGQDLPVKINIQASNINLLAWLGIPFSALVGLAGVWFLERRAAGNSPFDSSAFATWASVNGIMGLVAGGAAAYGIWFTRVSSDPAFGATGVAYITALATMIGAAASAGGATSAVKGPPRSDTTDDTTDGTTDDTTDDTTDTS